MIGGLPAGIKCKEAWVEVLDMVCRWGIFQHSGLLPGCQRCPVCCARVVHLLHQVSVESRPV